MAEAEEGYPLGGALISTAGYFIDAWLPSNAQWFVNSVFHLQYAYRVWRLCK